MTGRSTVAAGVLIGGASSRMGGIAKGNILIDGQRIIERTLGILSVLCAEQYLLGDPYQYENMNTPALPDAAGCSGPLAGIAALLEHVRGDILIVACDLPNLTQTVLRRLIQNRSNTPIAYRTPTHKHPLVSCWSYPHLHSVLQGAKSAASVHSVFKTLNGRWIDCPNEHIFQNLNAPGDVKALGDKACLLPKHV